MIKIKGVFLARASLHVGRQGVVVLIGNRVEFMIVATGATNGKPKKGLPKNVQLVFNPVGIILLGVGGRMNGFVKEPITRPDDGFVEFALRVEPWFLEQIACDVLDQELVIRKIIIESADQVVSVFMRMLQRVIELVPTGLGIADQIHPVTGPLLTEMRARQKLVHNLFERIGGGIFQKDGHLV